MAPSAAAGAASDGEGNQLVIQLGTVKLAGLARISPSPGRRALDARGGHFSSQRRSGPPRAAAGKPGSPADPARRVLREAGSESLDGRGRRRSRSWRRATPRTPPLSTIRSAPPAPAPPQHFSPQELLSQLREGLLPQQREETAAGPGGGPGLIELETDERDAWHEGQPEMRLNLMVCSMCITKDADIQDIQKALESRTEGLVLVTFELPEGYLRGQVSAALEGCEDHDVDVPVFQLSGEWILRWTQVKGILRLQEEYQARPLNQGQAMVLWKSRRIESIETRDVAVGDGYTLSSVKAKIRGNDHNSSAKDPLRPLEVTCGILLGETQFQSLYRRWSQHTVDAVMREAPALVLASEVIN